MPRDRLLPLAIVAWHGMPRRLALGDLNEMKRRALTANYAVMARLQSCSNPCARVRPSQLRGGFCLQLEGASS